MNRLFFILTVSAVFSAAVSCEQNRTTPEEPEVLTELKPLTESIKAGPEGGEFEIGYALINPTETGQITASVKGGSDWISGFDTATQGKITFSIDSNTVEVEREETIVVSYEDLSFDVSVVQAAAAPEEPKPEVIEFEADFLDGVYYGKLPGSEYSRWTIYLSDKELDEAMEANVPDAVYYYISIEDIRSAEEVQGGILIPDGTYSVIPQGLAGGTGFSGGYWQNDASGSQTDFNAYEEGELTVIKKQEGIYELTLTVVTDDGKSRLVHYEGEALLKDESPEEVDLPLVDMDVLDVDFARGYAWTEDSGVDGVTAIAVQLFTSDYAIMLDTKLYTSDLAPDATAIPAGRYSIGAEGEAVSGTFIPGYVSDSSRPMGTYLTHNMEAVYGIVDGGHFTVSESENGTKVEVDLTMDGYRLTGVFDSSLPVQQNN